ncbi:MAG: addiction module antidote protein, HigA family [Ammonifex sp.]|jgi:addiction module HigA family antidote|nr:MAG: addiction module antidote protein, HigA family [Ammonifex sp.]
MNEKELDHFHPDYTIPPGVTLLEVIESLDMNQAELANRTGRPVKTINEIIKGKTAITPETALQLERVLGVPASFWNNLERNYREALARREERIRLENQIEWLKQFPVSAMIRNKWIQKRKDDSEQLQEVLSFFGVVSPEAWEVTWLTPQASFRKFNSFKINPGAIAAWLRKGEIEALKIKSMPFNKNRFREALFEVRKLTKEPIETFVIRAKELCAQAGVVVLFIQELPMCPVSGAARWLSPEKALIQLNIRYKSDDHLFFSFFHESGHILRHGKRELFIDTFSEENGHDNPDKQEEDANRFARDFLIPPEAYRKFCAANRFTYSIVSDFARQLGVAPGIIVGRLQHDKIIPFNYLNKLRRRLQWAKPQENEA